MALFDKVCPQCGHKNSPQAGFCAQCGTPLGGGKLICGVCGTENRTDARFCKKCGRELAANAAPEVRAGRWARREDDFAVRIDSDDLPGILRRGIIVEIGTNALLIENGVNRGLLPPGNHTLDSLDKRVFDWLLSGTPRHSTALLVDVMPVELVFLMENLFSRDPIKISLSVRVQAQVEEPVRFLINMLARRERLTREDLRQYLSLEIAQLVNGWVGRHTIQELAEDLNLKADLELALEEALKTTFAQTGLKFLNVRTFEINMEHLDRVKGIKSQYALQVTEADANLQGKQRLLDVMKGLDLQALAEETHKVENEEQRAELYHRMRQSVLSEKMDEVRSEAQFEQFLEDQDRQKLLSEKERNELMRTWKEDAEDHDRGRAHLVAKLDLDRQYELRTADLKLRSDLSEQELEGELRLERMRASKQYEIDAARWEYELKHRRAEAEFVTDQRKIDLSLQAGEHDEEMRQLEKEMDLGIKGLRGIKQARLEAEKGEKELEWQDQQKKLDLEMQRERIRMEHELNRMDKLATLGTEALIAASPAEQGRILADLRRVDALKGMTEEQILAAAAKDSPDVAHALTEKYRAIAEGKSSEREREMYEKLLAEKDNHDRAASDAWRESTQAVRGMADKALETMRDTVTAFARGQGNQPVIITTSGGGVVHTAGLSGSEPNGETKNCPKCGRFVSAESTYCQHCGNEFAGVK
jgi:ribosomal protein L40E